MWDNYIQVLLSKCVAKDTRILFISYKREIREFVQKFALQAKNRGIHEIFFDEEDIYYTHDLLKKSSKEDILNSTYFDQSIWDSYAHDGASFLIFETEYPGLMDDVDDYLIALASKLRRESRPLYRKMVEKCQLSWCIAAYPGKVWASSLFSSDDAYERLEKALSKVCMLDCDNPILAWDKQLELVGDVIKKLNGLDLKKMHYSNSLGTSLDIYLPKDYQFSSAKDNEVIVNMPSYEVFASPHYLKTEGIVYSSKPLNYNGKIVDEFWLKFVCGKVVDYDARKGREILKSIIEGDGYSCYLGECALVAYDSPISNLNITFGTTLIDENASCHLALGAGFAECVNGGLDMDDDSLLKMGINQSKLHVDFMIGTKDLSIVGTTYDGREISIFENGNFSCEIIGEEEKC